MLQKYHKKVLASKLFNNLILLKFTYLIYNKNYFKNNYYNISFSRFQNEKNKYHAYPSHKFSCVAIAINLL